MKKCSLFSVLALAFLSPTAAWSQALEVTGHVKTPDERPAAGVPVIIQGPAGKRVVFTDETGRWTLYEAPAGTYSAKALPEIPMAGAGLPSAGEVPFTIKEKKLVDSFFRTNPKLEIQESLVVPQRF